MAGSTTKGIRKRKAKTERIAVVPVRNKEISENSIQFSLSTHPDKPTHTTLPSPNIAR